MTAAKRNFAMNIKFFIDDILLSPECGILVKMVE